MEPSLIPVLAQHMADAPAAPMFSGVHPAAIIIPIVALMIPMIVVPTPLCVRQARQKREMEHRERMKALEFGRHLPGDEPEWSPARVALKIGAGVPLGSMGIAWLANATLDNSAEVAWMAAGFIGFAGVICGSLLAIKAFGMSYQPSHGYGDAARKPAFDPDAYDHVGGRG